MMQASSLVRTTIYLSQVACTMKINSGSVPDIVVIFSRTVILFKLPSINRVCAFSSSSVINFRFVKVRSSHLIILQILGKFLGKRYFERLWCFTRFLDDTEITSLEKRQRYLFDNSSEFYLGTYLFKIIILLKVAELRRVQGYNRRGKSLSAASFHELYTTLLERKFQPFLKEKIEYRITRLIIFVTFTYLIAGITCLHLLITLLFDLLLTFMRLLSKDYTCLFKGCISLPQKLFSYIFRVSQKHFQ